MVEKSYKEGNMPLASFYGLNLDHYFNTVGIIGFNEFFKNLTGHGTFFNEGLAGEILDYINARLREFQEEDGVLYNLEMTPGEGSCYRLALKDRELFGDDIFTQGTKEAPYYSTLLTAANEDIFWSYRLACEEKLLPKFSGGTIFRMYLAREDTIPHTMKIIDRIAHSKVPYFDFTPTISLCTSCKEHWIGVLEKCPICHGPTEIWSRVVGYVRPVHKWNAGKRQEFQERKYVEFG
jgi:ribonucleoside-triphosphate reductase